MEIEELNRLLASAELRNPQGFSAGRERYLAEISHKAGVEAERQRIMDELAKLKRE